MATGNFASSVPPEVLDIPCSDVHLMKIGLKLTEWWVVAMLLHLEEGDIEDIEEKAKSIHKREILECSRDGVRSLGRELPTGECQYEFCILHKSSI